MPTVLLVEDDADLQVTTRLVLERHGFEVVVAGDGIDALTALREHRVDVALVDVVMPRMDGLTLTRRIRETVALPIVLLTARDLPSDQVGGLEAGADDYVVKPFDGDVLAARLRAVLRRGGAQKEPDVADVVHRDGLLIDLAGMTVQRDGLDVTLSATEFRLLEVLVQNVGVVLSRDRLLDLVWGNADWGDAHVVEVNVGRLRTKIGATQIETVRGVGYVMRRR